MRRIAAILAISISITACYDTRSAVKQPQKPETVLPPESGLEQLGRGDIIEVKVFMEPDLAGVYPVGGDGAIVFPMIGKVLVAERDAQEVAQDIRDRLAKGFLNDPQVTVFIRERTSQKVYVLGQVEKAGTFGFRVGMSVIEAITVAGGFTKLAATNRVRVTRVVSNAEQVYEVPAGEIGQGKAPNFQLEPGDIVYVPEAIF